MIDKLKPCPFCGGEAVEVTEEHLVNGHTDYGFVYVMCKDCRARVDTNSQLMEEAIKAWNRRRADG